MNTRFESAQQLEEWIMDWLKNETDVPAQNIAADTPLADYAMDSVEAALLVSDFNRIVGREIDFSIVWDALNIRELAAHLIEIIEPVH